LTPQRRPRHLLSNYVNILLVFVPLGIVAGATGWNATLVFILNCSAIASLPAVLSFATGDIYEPGSDYSRTFVCYIWRTQPSEPNVLPLTPPTRPALLLLVSTMDIDSRPGATGVAVAGGTPANGDIYLTLTPRQRPRSTSTNTTTRRSLPCKQDTNCLTCLKKKLSAPNLCRSRQLLTSPLMLTTSLKSQSVISLSLKAGSTEVVALLVSTFPGIRL
jgi:hypothetical protein